MGSVRSPRRIDANGLIKPIWKEAPHGTIAWTCQFDGEELYEYWIVARCAAYNLVDRSMDRWEIDLVRGYQVLYDNKDSINIAQLFECKTWDGL